MLIQYMLCYALHHNLWTQFKLSCRISLQEHPPLPLSGQPLRDPSSTYAVEAGPTSSHINGQRVSYTLPPPPLHTPPPHTPSSHPLLTPPPHTPSSHPLWTLFCLTQRCLLKAFAKLISAAPCLNLTLTQCSGAGGIGGP